MDEARLRDDILRYDGASARGRECRQVGKGFLPLSHLLHSSSTVHAVDIGVGSLSMRRGKYARRTQVLFGCGQTHAANVTSQLPRIAPPGDCGCIATLQLNINDERGVIWRQQRTSLVSVEEYV